MDGMDNKGRSAGVFHNKSVSDKERREGEGVPAEMLEQMAPAGVITFLACGIGEDRFPLKPFTSVDALRLEVACGTKLKSIADEEVLAVVVRLAAQRGFRVQTDSLNPSMVEDIPPDPSTPFTQSYGE